MMPAWILAGCCSAASSADLEKGTGGMQWRAIHPPTCIHDTVVSGQGLNNGIEPGSNNFLIHQFSLFFRIYR